jgi:hypothetical protein
MNQGASTIPFFLDTQYASGKFNAIAWKKQAKKNAPSGKPET